MRHVVLSDIHGNWEALMAVMEDSQAQGCTRYLCLGDIVGHGPNPAECLDYIRRLACPTVLGNRDEEAAGDASTSDLNPVARRALDWTRRQLSKEQKQWLRQLPLVHQEETFTLVHATLDTPQLWAYVVNKFDAMASLSHQSTPFCFYGHTHAPRCYREMGKTVQHLDHNTVALHPGSRYFINPGSVGQPRDGDWRAAYAIYDSDQQTIHVRRVEYDIQTTRKKVQQTGLFGHEGPD